MRLVTVQGSRRWRHRLILRDGRQLQGKNSENKHNGLNCGSHICHPDLKTNARKQPPCCPAFSVFGSCVPVRSVQSLRPLDLAHMHNRLEGGFRLCRRNGLNLHWINPQNRIPCAFNKSGPDFPNPTNERRATQRNRPELTVGRKIPRKILPQPILRRFQNIQNFTKLSCRSTARTRVWEASVKGPNAEHSGPMAFALN